MGGFFSPQQSPTTIVSPIASEFGPFAEQLVQAIAGLFQYPGPGTTPLEESTIRGGFLQAEPARQLLDTQVQGGFLPGVGVGNPFLDALRGGVEREGDVARRQLGAAAQRAGALTGTDYMNASAGLEAQLAQRRGELFANVFERERQRQVESIPLLGQMGQQLLSMASQPRQTATDLFNRPYQMGMQLMGQGGAGQVIPGQTSPSPFASLINLAGSFVPFFPGMGMAGATRGLGMPAGAGFGGIA